MFDVQYISWAFLPHTHTQEAGFKYLGLHLPVVQVGWITAFTFPCGGRGDPRVYDECPLLHTRLTHFCQHQTSTTILHSLASCSSLPEKITFSFFSSPAFLVYPSSCSRSLFILYRNASQHFLAEHWHGVSLLVVAFYHTSLQLSHTLSYLHCVPHQDLYPAGPFGEVEEKKPQCRLRCLGPCTITPYHCLLPLWLRTWSGEALMFISAGGRPGFPTFATHCAATGVLDSFSIIRHARA